MVVSVDLRLTNVCCVTRQYLFQILFFASKEGSQNGLLISMTYLSPPICIFLNTSFSKFYHSRSPFIRPSITWQKKSLQCFVQRISRAYPGNFIVILNNFRLPRQEETINKNKQNKTQQKINIYVFAFVSQKGKTERKMSWPFFY